MKGAAIGKAGAPVQVVDDLPKPEPADGQVLVKSVYAGINPVDAYMANFGLLVVAWPLVLGCDAAGVVVKAGPNAVGPLGPLKVGDEVCGCTRLGSPGYSTCQEYFLMDARVTIPKPKNITIEQAATVGVGAERTACLGIFNGLHVPLPNDHPRATDEWVLVTGGSGSVGKYALQILAALGYKVITTCSARSADLLKRLGAAEVVDYTLPESEQINKILETTGGKLTRIFDTTAKNQKVAGEIFSKVESGPKYFATVNDWEPIDSDTTGGASVYPIQLGPVGRPGNEQLNKDIEKFILVIHKLISEGKVKPAEYEVAGHGIEEADKAWQYQQSGKAGNKKVLVKVGEA